ncbi:MAG: hypothetical protein M1549_00405 [Candidatus Dependentiae bacterium]|jgi:hypothetical protein|nr:hypothetical protein [Candidatus Dependentiae bacterium]
MKNILYGTIYVVGLLLIGDCAAKTDAVDKLAQALRQVLEPSPAGGLARKYTWQREPKEVAKFYAKDRNKQLEFLNKKWDVYDNLSKDEQQTLEQETTAFTIFMIHDVVGSVLVGVQGGIAAVGGQKIEQLKIKQLDELVYDAAALAEPMANREYVERAKNLTRMAKCFLQKRKAKGKVPPGCKLCKKDIDCIRSMSGELAELADPIVSLLTDGARFAGNKTKSLPQLFGDVFLIPKSDMKKTKKYRNWLKMSVKLAKLLSKTKLKSVKGGR